jgi:cytochrome c oxidase assembly protein Cox11
MAKTLIKEIIIMLLLCLAIMLILGIILYEYVPMSKTIPNAVSYTTPENVKQELADSATVDESQIILTYEVDSTDLSNYAKIKDYKPGKANPFSSYETTSTTNTTSTSGTSGNSTTSGTTQTGESGNTTNSSNTTSENTTTSGGQFFQDKGTK